ncbi:stage II sporulation protein M [Paenibacillus tarimensis]
MFSWNAIKSHFGEMRGYVAFSTILLLAGIVVGGTNVQLEAFMESQIKGLEQLVEMAESSNNPTLFMFGLIFLNNAIKSVLVMYLGVVLGIVPILFLLINGMVLGYLFTKLADQGANVLAIFVKGILPHGIIEIPAIIVACAYGIRFGMLSLRGAGLLVKRKPGFGAEYERFAARTVPVMILLVAALLVAAIIESTFTAWLMQDIQRSM